MPAAVAIPLITAGASATTQLVGAKMQSKSASKAADVQTQAANRAAEMEAEAAKQQLAFQQQQAQLAQQNYMDTRNFNRQVYTDQQARLAPYRRFGEGAIAQLGRPIGG